VVYFDLTVGASDLTVGAIEVNSFGAIGIVGSADIYLIPGGSYVGNEQNGMAAWGSAPIATARILTQPAGTPTFAPLDASFTLTAGSTTAIAIVATGWQHAYTNGNGTTGVPGSGSNQTYANSDLQFTGGSANNSAFSSPTFDPRISNVSIHYTLGAGPLVAAISNPYGSGCYDLSATYYEQFRGPVDLAGKAGQSVTSVLMVPNGIGGYWVGPGPGLWFGGNATGTSNISNATAGSMPVSAGLPTGDDVVSHVDLSTHAPGFEVVNVPGAPGAWTDLYIDSNGQLSVDWGLSSDFTPSVSELLAEPPRWAPLWSDLSPNIQGSLHFDHDGYSCFVTWHNVPSFGVAPGLPGNSIQVALLAGGLIEFRYENLSPLGDSLVGCSSANGAPDPQGTDISASIVGGFDIGGTAVAPDLSTDARPLIGSAVNLTIDRIHPDAFLGALLVSFTSIPQGLDLASIGMAGCNAYIDPSLNQSYGLFVPSGPSETTAFLNPAGNLYIGSEIFFQAALLVTTAPNGLGANVSNALYHRLGTL